MLLIHSVQWVNTAVCRGVLNTQTAYFYFVNIPYLHLNCAHSTKRAKIALWEDAKWAEIPPGNGRHVSPHITWVHG
jgi:hypothetical protein